MAWDRLTYPKRLGGLGFRDFHAFNKAMLGKQGWRILQNPDSLVAKVLKAKYFPRTSFFEATLGHNPSFAWRSLWGVREVLARGSRWRIGEGSNVRVMEDSWLRGGGDKMVAAPQQEGVYNMPVKHLMVVGEKKWDKNKLEELFSLEVCEQILSTPLFDMVTEDKLVWEGDMRGNYTVKSGYRLIMEESWKRLEEWGNRNWSMLWGVKAPHKAKHLLWRLCKECVPTRVKLSQRHVECTLLCPLCNIDVETDFHAFFNCPHVAQCWNSAGLSHLINNRLLIFDNMQDLILDLCSQADSHDAGRAALLLWCIWQNRNDTVWNSNTTPANHLGQNALHLWLSWQAAQHFSSRGNEQQQAASFGSIAWEKPPPGWFKCNVDAAFSNREGRTAISASVRDSGGRFLFGQTKNYNSQMSIMEGEGLALLEAIILITSQGLNNVIFESDSQSIVHAVNANLDGISEHYSIVTCIRQLLSSFPNFKVKFLRRQANMVAHTLARAAISWASHRFIMYVPPCIASLINNEMA
jgi:ribonuclease HI